MASHLIRLAQAKQRSPTNALIDSSSSSSSSSSGDDTDDQLENDVDNDPFKSPCLICDTGYRCDSVPFVTPESPSCQRHVFHRKCLVTLY